MKSIRKILGAVLLTAGVIFAYRPDLIESSIIPTDTFQAIEQPIKWGVLIGLGVLFLIHHKLRPWLLTITAILFSLIIGFITARLIGMILIGFIPKQLVWLSIEIIAFVFAGLWYLRGLQRSKRY